ncbi:MAG: ketoacyl-ACP synthase III [Spirochaetales bacterium]|nr:ketoacyl-ACP synthase III [Spirochaetales bacterium]
MVPRILSTGRYIPERCVSNDELSARLDTSDEWIFSHTGIKTRYLAADNETTSSLALRAAQAALERAGKAPGEVDLILVATGSPDYPGFPSCASIVQEQLGCSQAAAMDVVAACSGFVYAVETARSFLVSGAARLVLVIGSEVFSRILDWSDRATCILFGDGAGAVLLGTDEGLPPNGDFRRSLLMSDGSGAETLTSRQAHSPYLFMNGRRVYNFAIKIVPELVGKILSENGLALDDLRWIVPHQANARIIESTAKGLGIPLNRFYMNIARYANTSGASIPIALDEMNEKGLLKRGDWVLLVGFGAGLTAGVNLFRW